MMTHAKTQLMNLDISFLSSAMEIERLQEDESVPCVSGPGNDGGANVWAD